MPNQEEKRKIADILNRYPNLNRALNWNKWACEELLDFMKDFFNLIAWDDKKSWGTPKKHSWIIS